MAISGAPIAAWKYCPTCIDLGVGSGDWNSVLPASLLAVHSSCDKSCIRRSRKNNHGNLSDTSYSEELALGVQNQLLNDEVHIRSMEDLRERTASSASR